MLSEIRLLFAMQNLWTELIISRYRAKVNTGFLLTKREIRFLNGTLGYKKRVSFSKCDFLLYKRDSRATIYLNLQFIERIIKQYEKTFPQYLYISRESLIKSEKCSICGKKISLRGGCNHKPGNLYMGELCLREVMDLEFLGTAIVSNPFDKYAVIHMEGQEYDYSVLKELMKVLASPYIAWYVEEMTKKRPEFLHIERNDKCPCGSGKKYKSCCMGTDNEYMPHNRITILGGYEIKEKPIKYSGRFISKKDNQKRG